MSDALDVRLPAEAESAGAARRAATGYLAGRGIAEDVVDTVALLLSEVVTNAVLHVRSAVEVRVSLSQTGGVLVEVFDSSPLLPAPRRHAEESITGRGMLLVESLATGYGAQPITGDGKAVWFCVGEGWEARPTGWAPPAPAASQTVVWLRGVPTGLYVVLQEHNESLLRDYALTALHDPAAVVHSGLIPAIERIRVRIATAFRMTADMLATLPSRLDVPLVLDDADRSVAPLLPEVFADAERLAQGGRLLTLPALPELRRLRSWVFAQLVDGGSALPPWDDITLETGDDPVGRTPVDLDISWVRDTERAVIVGDDRNRVVAASPAIEALLGWAPAELVGQRLTVLVPPQQREAHVTGFTKNLVTGRSASHGSVLRLQAQHRQGHTVPVHLVLERISVGNRVAFLGWLDRPPPPRAG